MERESFENLVIATLFYFIHLCRTHFMDFDFNVPIKGGEMV